jgi:protein-tyrosine phosphatase
MPEGLCPLSVQTMSQHMDQIIRNYTLKGRHVLVHCRGGVGRAGLVACTWMLKLGICGSVEPNSNGRRTIQDPSIQIPAEDLMQDKRVASDSLELLERVVYIIRRQRSVKAIETYEQVRFLLEFIEYLRDTDAQALGA